MNGKRYEQISTDDSMCHQGFDRSQSDLFARALRCGMVWPSRPCFFNECFRVVCGFWMFWICSEVFKLLNPLDALVVSNFECIRKRFNPNQRRSPRAAETYMEGKYAAELFMGFGKAAKQFYEFTFVWIIRETFLQLFFCWHFLNVGVLGRCSFCSLQCHTGAHAFGML